VASPVLTYGLEIVQPKQSNLAKLELFQKTILKQIMLLPINTPDPTAYILSELLSVEAIIDIKYMTRFLLPFERTTSILTFL
jgi:phage gp36-like protein